MTADDREFMEDVRFAQRTVIIGCRAFQRVQAQHSPYMEFGNVVEASDIAAISEQTDLHPVCVKWRLAEMGYVPPERLEFRTAAVGDVAKVVCALEGNKPLTPPEIAQRTGLTPNRVRTVLVGPNRGSGRNFLRQNLPGGVVRWSLKEPAHAVCAAGVRQ